MPQLEDINIPHAPGIAFFLRNLGIPREQHIERASTGIVTHGERNGIFVF